jgi:hypothetical protein
VVPPIVHPTPLRTPPCARGSSCSSRIDIELEIECEWCIKEVIVEVCLAKCRQG